MGVNETTTTILQNSGIVERIPYIGKVIVWVVNFFDNFAGKLEAIFSHKIWAIVIMAFIAYIIYKFFRRG